MSDNQKTRKQIRTEAKELIAADRLREREARNKRVAENNGKPLVIRWKAYWQEVADNRLVRKQRNLSHGKDKNEEQSTF